MIYKLYPDYFINGLVFVIETGYVLCEVGNVFKFHHRTGHEGPEGVLRRSCTLSSTYALDGSGWSTPCPQTLYPRARERSITHCTGSWVGPRAGLDECGKSHPHRDSIPAPSSPWRVAVPIMLIPTHEHFHSVKNNVKDLCLTAILKSELNGYNVCCDCPVFNVTLILQAGA
jgi:hypothetical protein